MVVQSLSHVWPFVIPWTVACHASLSFTIFQSLCKCLSIKSVMPSNHLILCHPLLLLPSIFPSIRVFSNDLTLFFFFFFSNELTLHIWWSKYWSFSFSISNSTFTQNPQISLFKCSTWTFQLNSISEIFINHPLNPHGSLAKDSRSFSRLTYPEYSLKGLMLMLGLQYFGHLMQRADSLEKTLKLGKTEGRRQGRQTFSA